MHLQKVSTKVSLCRLALIQTFCYRSVFFPHNVFYSIRKIVSPFFNIFDITSLFSHNVFYSIRKLYPHLSIFLTSYLYLLLKWKSSKLTWEVKGQPITRGQILDSSKLKEFADDNFKFDENGSKLSKRVENTVGKGEIARYEQFLSPVCHGNQAVIVIRMIHGVT